MSNINILGPFLGDPIGKLSFVNSCNLQKEKNIIDNGIRPQTLERTASIIHNKKKTSLDNEKKQILHAKEGIIIDDWTDIISSVHDKTYLTKYQIGDVKALDLGSEGILEMQIVAFDMDELPYDRGKASITWISKNLMKTTHRMNPDQYKKGAVGGWRESELRTWLNKDIKQLLPVEVLTAIKTVKKVSAMVLVTSYSNDIPTYDDLWIPSKYEIFGNNVSRDLLCETSGSIYTELFATNNDRIKRTQKISVNSAGWWWLRSASNDFNFFGVSSDGSYSGMSASYSGGVPLGFCI